MKIFTLVVLLTFAAVGYAQQPVQKSEAEIRTLLKKASSKDFKESDKAKEKLSKLDSNYLPVLFKMVKKGKPWERVEIAGLITGINRNNEEIVPILVDLARGATILSLFNLKEEFSCRQAAFWGLALSADGIRELVKILKDGDSWERQNVLFAFDDLTETTNYEGEILQIMIEAVPVIARGLKSKDQRMQDVSYEVLEQIQNSDVKEISELAKKYLDENPRD